MNRDVISNEIRGLTAKLNFLSTKLAINKDDVDLFDGESVYKQHDLISESRRKLLDEVNVWSKERVEKYQKEEEESLKNLQINDRNAYNSTEHSILYIKRNIKYYDDCLEGCQNCINDISRYIKRLQEHEKKVNVSMNMAKSTISFIDVLGSEEGEELELIKAVKKREEHFQTVRDQISEDISQATHDKTLLDTKIKQNTKEIWKLRDLIALIESNIKAESNAMERMNQDYINEKTKLSHELEELDRSIPKIQMPSDSIESAAPRRIRKRLSDSSNVNERNHVSSVASFRENNSMNMKVYSQVDLDVEPTSIFYDFSEFSRSGFIPYGVNEDTLGFLPSDIKKIQSVVTEALEQFGERSTVDDDDLIQDVETSKDGERSNNDIFMNIQSQDDEQRIMNDNEQIDTTGIDSKESFIGEEGTECKNYELGTSEHHNLEHIHDHYEYSSSDKKTNDIELKPCIRDEEETAEHNIDNVIESVDIADNREDLNEHSINNKIGTTDVVTDKKDAIEDSINNKIENTDLKVNKKDMIEHNVNNEIESVDIADKKEESNERSISNNIESVDIIDHKVNKQESCNSQMENHGNDQINKKEESFDGNTNYVNEHDQEHERMEISRDDNVSSTPERRESDPKNNTIDRDMQKIHSSNCDIVDKMQIKKYDTHEMEASQNLLDLRENKEEFKLNEGTRYSDNQYCNRLDPEYSHPINKDLNVQSVYKAKHSNRDVSNANKANVSLVMKDGTDMVIYKANKTLNGHRSFTSNKCMRLIKLIDDLIESKRAEREAMRSKFNERQKFRPISISTVSFGFNFLDGPIFISSIPKVENKKPHYKENFNKHSNLTDQHSPMSTKFQQGLTLGMGYYRPFPRRTFPPYVRFRLQLQNRIRLRNQAHVFKPKIRTKHNIFSPNF